MIWLAYSSCVLLASQTEALNPAALEVKRIWLMQNNESLGSHMICGLGLLTTHSFMLLSLQTGISDTAKWSFYEDLYNIFQTSLEYLRLLIRDCVSDLLQVIWKGYLPHWM